MKKLLIKLEKDTEACNNTSGFLRVLIPQELRPHSSIVNNRKKPMFFYWESDIQDELNRLRKELDRAKNKIEELTKNSEIVEIKSCKDCLRFGAKEIDFAPNGRETGGVLTKYRCPDSENVTSFLDYNEQPPASCKFRNKTIILRKKVEND